MHDDKIIPFSRSMRITNLESIPRGLGRRYLLVVLSPNSDGFIAKQWKSTVPKQMHEAERLLDFSPKTL